MAAVVGAGLLGLLVTASLLVPDARGRGTHQQLGLPPCTFAVVAGIPCPACGMTTSWSLITHARPWDALRTHTSGTLLALAAAVTGLGAVIVAASGRQLAWQPSDRLLAIAGVATALLIVAEWLIRLSSGW